MSTTTTAAPVPPPQTVGTSAALRTQYRILDARQRQRRIQESIDFLEKDNLHQDPHGENDSTPNKKAPKFEEQLGGTKRFRLPRPKTLEQIIDEDCRQAGKLNYLSLTTRGLKPDSSGKECYGLCSERNIPKRRFCAVCGQVKQYDCLACGSHLCSLKCKTHHEATRCIKWA